MERIVANGRIIGLMADMVEPEKKIEVKAETVEVEETPTEKPETTEKVAPKKSSKKNK